MRKWITDFCTNCAKNFCCTCECTELKLYNYKQKLLDKIEKAKEEIIAESGTEHIDGADCDDILIVELRDVLEILDRVIAESEDEQ